ncbi:MAG: Gfo/Idh/MocA family oxidoreductase [Verrucomicrobia bacterium]|nr:Gfo/Idh/MocA family oxidoreductase [Verrucomicrobiota bacterium]
MPEQNNEARTHSSRELSRREFMAGTGAAGLSFTILKPELAFGAEANSKITWGLIGCGGRGTWIANLFQKHGGYNLVGVADYFQDRVDSVGEKFQVPASRRYTGLSGYRRLLEQKLDAIVIQTPPYFHPEQAAAAVDAGCHVYLAKPIAVDIPGCQSIADSGQKAAGKKRVFLVDFQTRAHALYQEAIQRVHRGDIGRLVCGEATYQTSLMFSNLDAKLRAAPSSKDLWLRAWALDRVLSGDVITEQNIHALDVASWILNAAPLRATGTGGKARELIGTCWDHFAVIFNYPGDVVLTFCSKQVGAGWEDIQCRIYGTNGTIDTHYGGNVAITGKAPFVGGSTGNLYADGAVRNIACFYDQITSGDYSNPTVAPSVRSNLTTILGRAAAYQRREVTWDEMMRTNEKLEYDLSGFQS